MEPTAYEILKPDLEDESYLVCPSCQETDCKNINALIPLYDVIEESFCQICGCVLGGSIEMQNELVITKNRTSEYLHNIQ